MKIAQSNIAMESERQASKVFATQTAVSERVWKSDAALKDRDGNEAATMELSAKGKELYEKLRSRWEESLHPRQQTRLERKMNRLLGMPAQSAPGDTEEDFKIKMMRRLMESLRALQEGRQPDYDKLERLERKSSFRMQAQQSQSFAWGSSIQFMGSMGSRAIAGGTGHWEEKVTMSTIFSDREVTCFSTAGQVQTADGRCIDFNLNLEMSREFTQSMGMEYTRKSFCVDPLVINLEGNPASFSDQTFFFDLNGDGKEEELAELSAGSGFLALDKNHDGKINDGNELFGTKSGDGFKDLSAYDEDGNGWIDENDSVFKDLKVWTKGGDGKERLLALGQAGVGAIYLGNASTEFSLNKPENNETQGIIRSTGIFLKESGEVGTIQHVDWVI